MRTGPLGRLARLALAAVAAESLASIADQGGPASFRGARNLTEPGLLLLDAVMLVLFVSLAGVIGTSILRRASASRWEIAALAALLIAVGVAAATSQLAHGTVWDSPLSDLVWWFDFLMLLETIVAILVAVVIGLPGCEIGVWPLLAARVRGERIPFEPIGCVIGLHILDGWEAARHHGR